MDYRVDLETFRGPLDLLLYLVKRNEVDICDIPIARIAEQFQDYLQVLSAIDVEGAGEFLIMAATLMEIKSKLLLPRPEEESNEEEDPRQQLVKQLMEYKKFKDAAKNLEEQATQQMLRLPRVPVDQPAVTKPTDRPIHKVELWDLVSAFGRLLQETIALKPQQIFLDETPIHINMEQILDRLRREKSIYFSNLFEPPRTRGRLLGYFLALLELIKGKHIIAEQGDLFGDIRLSLADNDSGNDFPLVSSFDEVEESPTPPAED